MSRISVVRASASATSTDHPRSHSSWLPIPAIVPGVSVQTTDHIAVGLDKPRLRGVLHQAAFVIAVVLAPLLIVGAHGERARLAAAVFAGSVAACFGVSALYHRVTWSPRARLWMRRIDHAGIYLLIAG